MEQTDRESDYEQLAIRSLVQRRDDVITALPEGTALESITPSARTKGLGGATLNTTSELNGKKRTRGEYELPDVAFTCVRPPRIRRF